jgi:hypothetical protein
MAVLADAFLPLGYALSGVHRRPHKSETGSDAIVARHHRIRVEGYIGRFQMGI